MVRFLALLLGLQTLAVGFNRFMLRFAPLFFGAAGVLLGGMRIQLGAAALGGGGCFLAARFNRLGDCDRSSTNKAGDCESRGGHPDPVAAHELEPALGY